MAGQKRVFARMLRPSTFFVAAARTWMPGPERPLGCLGPGMTAQGGLRAEPETAKKPLHFLVISSLWG
jgi:hypothetical protein